MYDRNKVLLAKFGITVEEYAAMLAEQGGVCKICGWKPRTDTRPLHVEHDHKIAALLIKVRRASVGYAAWCPDLPLANFVGDTRGDARKKARVFLLRLSIRGLVCWACNSGLKWFRDSSDKLRAAAFYLDEFNAKRIPECTPGDALAVLTS